MTENPHNTPAVTSFNRSAGTSALLAACAAALLPSSARAFTEFARGAVTLETEARLTYDSYFIGATKLGDDDYYATLTPQLKYARKAGLAEINAFAGLSLNRYDTYKQFNSEEFSAGFRSQLPVGAGSRISGDVNIGYNESTVIDYTVLDRIPTKSLFGSLNLRYQTGLKTSLADSLTYSDTSRHGAYSDQEAFGNNLSFTYGDFLEGTALSISHGYARTTSSGENALGAKLDQTSNSLSATLTRPIVGKLMGDATYGYRILHRSALENVVGQSRSSGSFFNVSLRGPFLSPIRFPKLESSASIAYEESRSPGINDLGQKTLTGDVRLSWDARERTRLSIRGSRTVDLAATDLSVENTDVAFTVSESIGLATHLDGQIGYTWRSFRGVSRDDHTLTASLTGRYSISRFWSAGAGYTYQKNDTSSNSPQAILALYRLRAADYERHVVSVFATNVF